LDLGHLRAPLIATGSDHIPGRLRIRFRCVLPRIVQHLVVHANPISPTA